MQFEKAPNLGRMLTQDDWKRTQVRMPQNLYAELSVYAGEQQISLNSAMIDLMDKGLTAHRNPPKPTISNTGVVEPTLKANYFTQKLYGLIYMANTLESRINNTEYVLKHTDDPKQIERYNILLDICQHDLENIKNNIENSLNAINNENFAINQELAIQTATILNKKPTS